MSTAERDADGTPPLRARKRARTRADMVEAALRLLATREYADMTVDEIAAAAMVSRGTFFNYFGGKGGIILAWARQVQAELVATVGEHLAHDPPDEPLDTVMRAILALMDHHPAALRTLLGELYAPDPRRAAQAREVFDLAAVVAPIIAAGQASGSFRADVAASDLAQFAASALIGAALRSSGPDDPATARALHLLETALAPQNA